MNRRKFISTVGTSMVLLGGVSETDASQCSSALHVIPLERLKTVVGDEAAVDSILLEVDTLLNILFLGDPRLECHPDMYKAYGKYEQGWEKYNRYRSDFASSERRKEFRIYAESQQRKLQARLEDSRDDLLNTLSRLRSALRDAGVSSSSGLMTRFIRGFSIFNEYLFLRGDSHWYCYVYMLELVLC